jgi:hypothetical protein
MSYAAQSTGKGGIRVGANAARDPILASASYEAALILKSAIKRPRSLRDEYVKNMLTNHHGTAAAQSYERRLRSLGSKGWNRNQAIYDAIRLSIADAMVAEGVLAVDTALKQEMGVDQGLGISKKGRAIGCGIVGGTTLVGGIVGSIYGGQAGGQGAAVGGQLVGGVLDCNKAEREAAQQMAAQQAAAAQAELERTQALAADQAARRKETTKRVLLVAGIGGAVAVVGLIGYAIVKA